MKPINLALAALLTLGTAGVAQAQNSPFTNPGECSADAAALDVNQDGYISGEEIAGKGAVETNVDTNGDGYVSVSEMTVACNSRTSDALTPK
jgi:hypothetical protein